MTDKIGLIVDDMFFASKIKGAAEAAGRTLERIRSQEQLENNIVDNPPALLLVDLHANRINPIQAIEFFKSRPELNEVPIVGFFSHVEVALKQAAERAGCDYILPRSAFTQRLGEIVSGAFEAKSRQTD